jgi:hypothetical protein
LPGLGLVLGAGLSREQAAMRVFDKNGDGKLDAEERAEAMKFIERTRGHLLNAFERAGAERFLDQIGGKLEPADGAGTGAAAK